MRRSAPAVIDSVRRRGLRYRATINGRNPGGYPTDARQNQNGCDGWAQLTASWEFQQVLRSARRRTVPGLLLFATNENLLTQPPYRSCSRLTLEH